MPTFKELENKVKDYMLLEDDGIIKLICAFAVASRLPLPPPWVFIVSSSSGGKTKLIELLSGLPGYTEVDEMTANTLLSGKQRSDKSASFLHEIPQNGFLVFKDFTTLLSKYKEQLQAIIGQLRLVYDGNFVKKTGHGDNIEWHGKAPLLAAVTTKIYTTSQSWGEMGERFVMYHLKQPSNKAMGSWIINRRKDDKKIETELKTAFAEFIMNVNVATKIEDLPEIEDSVKNDLVEIAYLTVSARSPIERNQWDNKHRMEMKHDGEMIGRFLKQLMCLAYGLMAINQGPLNDYDRKILYKIGLDSIPQQRFEVMRALTKNRLGGDINQIADFLRYPYETVELWVHDLVALGILQNHTEYLNTGKKKTYHIEPEFMEIISKFEGIKPEEKALPPSEEQKTDAVAGLVPPPENIINSVDVGLPL